MVRNVKKETSYRTVLNLPKGLSKYDEWVREEVKHEREKKQYVYLKDVKVKAFKGQQAIEFIFGETNYNKRDLIIFQQTSKEKYININEYRERLKDIYPLCEIKDIMDLGRVWLGIIKKPEKK